MFPLRQDRSWIRVSLAGVALIMFAWVYVMQEWSAAFFVNLPVSESIRFILSKTSRFFINDVACLMLIAAIFNSPSHVRLGWWVFLFELSVLLPLYFILKLTFEGTSEISTPLLSQLHRMIINPLLMFVLIAGLLLQKYSRRDP